MESLPPCCPPTVPHDDFRDTYVLHHVLSCSSCSRRIHRACHSEQRPEFDTTLLGLWLQPRARAWRRPLHISPSFLRDSPPLPLLDSGSGAPWEYTAMALIPPDPASKVELEDEAQICTPEHCFHAFDALYCALTHKKPIPPKFANEK